MLEDELEDIELLQELLLEDNDEVGEGQEGELLLLWLEWELTDIDCEEEEQEKLCELLEQLEQLQHEELWERELEEKLNDEDKWLGLELLQL